MTEDEAKECISKLPLDLGYTATYDYTSDGMIYVGVNDDTGWIAQFMYVDQLDSTIHLMKAHSTE